MRFWNEHWMEENCARRKMSPERHRKDDAWRGGVRDLSEGSPLERKGHHTWLGDFGRTQEVALLQSLM